MKKNGNLLAGVRIGAKEGKGEVKSRRKEGLGVMRKRLYCLDMLDTHLIHSSSEVREEFGKEIRNADDYAGPQTLS